MRTNVVDLENYLRIGDWRDCLHPVIAMNTLFAGELSVCGPRNNDGVSCAFLSLYIYCLMLDKSYLTRI